MYFAFYSLTVRAWAANDPLQPGCGWQERSAAFAGAHTVSHRLHSATLENLGLVPGIGALCKEFSDRHGIEIDFSSEDVPSGVHPEIALCLFRIVQEALQNLKKHSGAVKAEVRLCRIRNKLLVSISDEGNGFDPRVSGELGLGIRSMRERAHLVGGHLKIYSEPGKEQELKQRCHSIRSHAKLSRLTVSCAGLPSPDRGQGRLKQDGTLPMRLSRRSEG